jgi:general secretion pathway protein L
LKTRATSAIWSLAGGRLVRLDGTVEGSALVVVPSEAVLLLATPLPPLQGQDRRRRALPFAIEDRIADPLDRVHAALGAELSPGVWLAGVVSHAVMREWITTLNGAAIDDAAAGLERARLIPDALLLPVPGPGQWSVDRTGNRAVVRTDDGSGFAGPLSLLATAWQLAGKPVCVALGEPLPPEFAAIRAETEGARPAERVREPALDLRQGAYAPQRRPVGQIWRKIALVAGAGALAQGAIAVADTLALTRLASERTAKVRDFAETRQPPVVIGSNLADALDQLTPDPSRAGPGRFIPLLSRTATALAASHVTANWRSVAYDEPAGTLTLEIETREISDLQAIAQALTRAGLSAQAGTASSDNGRAVGSFVIRAA